MKIFIISDDFPPSSFGGAGIIAEAQALELAKRGYSVSVITAVLDNEKEKVINYKGLTIYTVRDFGTIKKILKQELPDVVHIHNIHQKLSYKVFPLARKYSKKVFFTAHDAISVHYSKIFPKIISRQENKIIFDYRVSVWHQLYYFWREWRPFRNEFIRLHLKKADRIFAVSYALKEALEQNGLSNIEVLHNGIDPHKFVSSDAEMDEFRANHGLLNKKALFLAGRISRAKGGEVALNLLVKIHKDFPEACLMVAGRETSYLKSLKERAFKMGVGEKFICLGWLDRKQIIRAYAASDICLTLSVYTDPFPTVNLEAMVSKKPVLGTCFGGTPEIVVDGITGYIVNPNDIEAVAERALTLLQKPDLSQSLGKTGFERILEKFQLSQVVDFLEKKYASS